MGTILITGDVAVWRYSLLIEAGFESEDARTIATTPAYDLHELLRLVDRGCPPDLAIRILAPL